MIMGFIVQANDLEFDAVLCVDGIVDMYIKVEGVWAYIGNYSSMRSAWDMVEAISEAYDET